MMEQRQKYLRLSVGIAASILVVGCQTNGSSLPPNRQPLTLQQQAALAVNKDYQFALETSNAVGRAGKNTSRQAGSDLLTTAATQNNDVSSLPAVAPENAFGPRIGNYFLADDYVVYRHAHTRTQIEGTPELLIDLTYFLVSPEGTIQDYATGQASLMQSSCLQLYANQAIICDEPERLSQDFDHFDGVMLTSAGGGLGSWNVSANAAEAQFYDPFSAADQTVQAQKQ